MGISLPSSWLLINDRTITIPPPFFFLFIQTVHTTPRSYDRGASFVQKAHSDTPFSVMYTSTPQYPFQNPLYVSPKRETLTHFCFQIIPSPRTTLGLDQPNYRSLNYS